MSYAPGRKSNRTAQENLAVTRREINRFRKVRKDWSKRRRVIMTRAVYTKCRTHADVAERLLGPPPEDAKGGEK